MVGKKYAVLSLSGGMDSSTLLLHLLAQGFEVQCLSFDYGQKHKIELERAQELVEYINGYYNHLMDRLPAQTGPSFFPVKHQIIKLDGLSNLLNSTLVEGGNEVPEGHYSSENMKDTVVPNRNKIFSSIIQAVALSIAEKNQSRCSIAMGIHAGDHAIYPDCRPEFRDADYEAFAKGNDNHHLVNYYTPYLTFDKTGILKDGIECCKILGLNFEEVYKRTNTSYKPIELKIGEKPFFHGMSTIDVFEWFSDYKSASSVERIEAFLNLGLKDPIKYAEIIPSGEAIPRTWDEVVTDVKQVLEKHKK